MNMLFDIIPHLLTAQLDWAILALRLALGLIFLAHGARKAKSWSGVVGWFDSIGFKPAILWAGIATAIELFSGAALLLGIHTSIAALLLSLLMIVALLVNLKARAGFFKVIELDIILLAALFVLASLGGSGFFTLVSFL